MTNLKTILVASTAMALAGAAWADNNEAWLDQIGSNHSAMINQAAGSNNKAGANGNSVTQSSLNTSLGNTLTITQSGDDNDVGLGVILNRNSGFFQLNQSGQGSTATVSQTSNGNSIVTINQVARTGNFIGNSLTVTQEVGDDNSIGAISQDRSGSTDGTVAGRIGHTATILQSGSANEIGLARQGTQFDESAANGMSLEQTGADNYIGNAIQSGTSNSMTAVFTGNDNGADNGKGTTSFGSGIATFADDAGVPQGDLTQIGDSNFIDMMVTADRTYFGIQQTGDRNRVDPITITGTRNELGILQQGNYNLASVSDIATFGNNIGIRQVQDNNTATVSFGTGVLGGNKFGILQDGMWNTASVSISDGGANGIVPPYASLAGPAGLVAGTAGFERGMIKQLGDLNAATITVVGSENEFGTLQDGNDNFLSASMTGTLNVSAIAQVGSNNLSSTSQNGSNNNLGVSQ
ncbi:hypothetical protein PXK58_19015 [Phaeobacter gallaeciensis]|uniref:hypothetical protein n=1 Tax=Phaeobacter gallaeciensis TaxID=60890 RepID=UPI00238090F8|nr:hypothetical protein [Phaeobacter gallaeciensis]MDE4276369.1 hypothetical protein [Phaeobacter gallaeciensis]MDE4301652.1 hypothetical protein [Phaeobacter gallaeciensis]MDE5186807.1 hypothetical protein [Phaeobacter gallaeciensis]